MTELSAEFLGWAAKQKIKESIQEVRARPTHLHSITASSLDKNCVPIS